METPRINKVIVLYCILATDHYFWQGDAGLGNFKTEKHSLIGQTAEKNVPGAGGVGGMD